MVEVVKETCPEFLYFLDVRSLISTLQQQEIPG